VAIGGQSTKHLPARGREALASRGARWSIGCRWQVRSASMVEVIREEVESGDEMRRRGNEERARSGSYRPLQPAVVLRSGPAHPTSSAGGPSDSSTGRTTYPTKASICSSGAPSSIIGFKRTCNNISAHSEHREGAHLRGKYAAFVLAPSSPAAPRPKQRSCPSDLVDTPDGYPAKASACSCGATASQSSMIGSLYRQT
jgi:hypothetical protein